METQEGPWRAFSFDGMVTWDKASLGNFWLKNESLEDSAGLADPDLIAAEIVEDLQAALEEFAQIAADLGAPVEERPGVLVSADD